MFLHIGNNVGVFIQNVDCLKRDNYSPTIQYIGACAQPLYDPGGIWYALEQEALEHVLTKGQEKRARREIYGNIFIRNWRKTRKSNPIQKA